MARLGFMAVSVAIGLSLPAIPAQQPAEERSDYRFDPGPLSAALDAALSFEDGVFWGSSHFGPPKLREWDPLLWTRGDWTNVAWAAHQLRDRPLPSWMPIDFAVKQALSSERDDDAWRHAMRHDAAMLSARLPWFLPGVDERGYSYKPLVLDAGVTLRPALPPPTGLGGVPERRSMEVIGFYVGIAKVAMKVSVEGDGIELEFRHLAGPAVEFNAVIPCPPRLVMTAEYANWEVQEGIGLPRAVLLEPDAPPWRLWGRYEPAPPAWPGHAPLELTAQMQLAGFELLVPEDTPEGDDGLPGLALVIEAVTKLPCPVIRGAPPRERTGLAPITIDLRSPERRPQKVSALLSLLERHALGPDLGVAAAAAARDR